jgi:TolA-binding protein
MASPMRKAALVVGVLGLVAVTVFVVRSSWRTETAGDLRPEVIRVGTSQATVIWRTPTASTGRLHYRPVGVEAPHQSAEDRLGPAKKHRVVIEGLEPSTRYRYWLHNDQNRYELQTQPEPATPFSFLLVWGDVSRQTQQTKQIKSLLRSEAPEFVLSLAPATTDPFRDVRPFVPVFNRSGVSSAIIRQRRPEGWSLDWGGLHLVFCGGEKDLSRELNAPAAHVTGIVLKGEGQDLAWARSSGLHARLVSHNKRHPSSPALFVIAAGGDAIQSENADGISYLRIPVRAKGQGSARFDVGPESVVAFFIDSGQEVTLRESAVKRKRTCRECRQLADRGAYEESVKAYKEFIKTHAGHYQIDDAHYAIAEILDENLFRFEEALVWYRRLVAAYPDSSLAPLARQRIKYLEAHSDHGHKPLARFERIRRVELASARNSPAGISAALDKVQAIIDEFPESKLAPAMTYWLANQYRQLDPERAVATYRGLIKKYPGASNVEDARIEIGETYYSARRYSEAIAAYLAALAALPSRAGAIETQIKRSRRNQTRGTMALCAGASILLVLGLGFFWRPVGLPRARFLSALKAFLPLACIVSGAGWLIHEQFSSAGELLGLAFSIAASASFGYPFTSGFADKLLLGGAARQRAGKRALAGLVSFVLGIVLLGAAAYLATYSLNEHYLTGFGM